MISLSFVIKYLLQNLAKKLILDLFQQKTKTKHSTILIPEIKGSLF